MNLELKGVVTKIGEVQSFGTGDFQKRNLYIESIDENQRKYNDPYCLEVTNKNFDILDGVKVGNEINAFAQISSREWTSPKTQKSSTFTSLRVWKLENMSKPTISANNRPLVDTPIIKDDLPF